MAQAQWADGPFQLLKTPKAQGMDLTEHASINIANDMAIVHNCLIRGLNAIYLQAQFVPSTEAKDFLFFVRAWATWVKYHHDLEDHTMFPAFEELAGKPGLMEINRVQHEEFIDGIQKLLELSADKVTSFDAKTIRDIIDDMAPPMNKHLTEEIDTLLALREFDSERLKEAYAIAEKANQNPADELKPLILPLAFSLRDVTYEGGTIWPPMPPPVVKKVVEPLAELSAGAWKFAPCDIYGQPRALQFVG